MGHARQEVVRAPSAKEAIEIAAFEHGIDAKLMLAIAHVESSMNPKAKGALGEVGLFQLRPEHFGKLASTDALVNARAAAKYLKWLKERPRCKSYGSAWFVCHNTGAFRAKPLAKPHEFSYYKKVKFAKSKLFSPAVNTAQAVQ